MSRKNESERLARIGATETRNSIEFGLVR